jgi:hypothetical protein
MNHFSTTSLPLSNRNKCPELEKKPNGSDTLAFGKIRPEKLFKLLQYFYLMQKIN